MPPDQLHYHSVVLSVFAISNTISLLTTFMTEVRSIKARFFLWSSTFDLRCFKTSRTVLLPDTYTYIKSEKKQNEIYNAIETINAVGVKAKWAEMWCNSQYSTFAEGLVAFAKRHFLGSFCAIFTKCDLCFAYELISLFTVTLPVSSRVLTFFFYPRNGDCV
jgi:hypothetical protein